MTQIYNRTDVKQRRRNLRNKMSDAEVRLWAKLKSRQLLGRRFLRQYSVGQYIVDFYCPQLKLGIELDGDSHFRDGAKQYDTSRQEFIETIGIRIVRYLNTDVYDNMDGLLENLVVEMRQREEQRQETPLAPL